MVEWQTLIRLRLQNNIVEVFWLQATVASYIWVVLASVGDDAVQHVSHYVS